MRRIIPEFLIQPIQTLDGYVRPRAKLTISLARLGERPGQEYVPHETDFGVILDLFEPPGYLHHLQACVAAKASDSRLSLKGLGVKLGLNHMLIKRALDYARRMEKLGWKTPYKEVRARPASASRWKPRRRIA
jgi:hypothetical protein